MPFYLKKGFLMANFHIDKIQNPWKIHTQKTFGIQKFFFFKIYYNCDQSSYIEVFVYLYEKKMKI